MPEVLFEKPDDGVGLITLNRPDSLYALTGEMFAELARLLAECEGDREVRCLAITGAGRAFCAGGDVKDMAGRVAGPGGASGSVAGVVECWTAELRGWHDAPSGREPPTLRGDSSLA